MKNKLTQISDDLNHGVITEKEAKYLLLNLLGVSRSTSDEEKNLNDFILNCLSVSEDKRKLPFIIQCPNGLEVFPSIKMKFENFGSPMLGDDLEAMAVTWRD